jgi:hypothetical protein
MIGDHPDEGSRRRAVKVLANARSSSLERAKKGLHFFAIKGHWNRVIHRIMALKNDS